MVLLRDVIAYILETLSEQYASELKALHLHCGFAIGLERLLM
jgi:hypothetical protein